MQYTQKIKLYTGLNGAIYFLNLYEASTNLIYSKSCSRTVEVCWNYRPEIIRLQRADENGSISPYWKVLYVEEGNAAEENSLEIVLKILQESEVFDFFDDEPDEILSTSQILDFMCADNTIICSDVEFDDFDLSYIEEYEDLTEIVFNNCTFRGYSVFGYTEVGESLKFNSCIFEGTADFSGRVYKNGLHMINCKCLGFGNSGELNLSSIYYGSDVYLENNHIEVFTDFFDSNLKKLTLSKNFFLRGSNLFAKNQMIDIETSYIKENTGDIKFTNTRSCY